MILSDEKSSTWMVLDGLMYYWHDLRKRKLDISRRAFGGGSVMVWGAIFANGNHSWRFSKEIKQLNHTSGL